MTTRRASWRVAVGSFIVAGAVFGAVLPRSFYKAEEKQAYRYVTANGIPDHAAGQFPNAHNPNSIREQQYSFRMPRIPVAGNRSTPVRRFLFGGCVVLMCSPLKGLWRSW